MKDEADDFYIESTIDIDFIEKLAPNASTEVKQLLIQLRDRNAEIETWFQSDPSRLNLLQKDPESTINELFASMKLYRPKSMQHKHISKKWKIKIKPNKSPLGSTLFLALWEHVSSSQVNSQNFKDKPFQVIDTVASSTKASYEEKTAVINAWEKRLGILHIDVGEINTFRLIPGNIPNVY